MTERNENIVDDLVTALKDVSRKNGISSYALAYSSGVGRNTIMSNFSGRNSPSLDSLRRLATALGYKVQLVPMTEAELALAEIGELSYKPILDVAE